MNSSHGLSGVRRYVSAMTTTPAMRRRRLLYYVLGCATFSGFNFFLEALKDVHGDADEEVVAEIENRE